MPQILSSMNNEQIIDFFSNPHYFIAMSKVGSTSLREIMMKEYPEILCLVYRAKQSNCQKTDSNKGFPFISWDNNPNIMSFTLCRNPFLRFISSYNYIVSSARFRGEFEKVQCDPSKLTKSELLTFVNDYPSMTNKKIHDHYMTQCDQVRLNSGNSLELGGVDVIGMIDDIDRISQLLVTHKVNSNKNKLNTFAEARDFYTDELLAQVKVFFKEDIDTINYLFNIDCEKEFKKLIT